MIYEKEKKNEPSWKAIIYFRLVDLGANEREKIVADKWWSKITCFRQVKRLEMASVIFFYH